MEIMRKAILLLHEIYGKNQFIQQQSSKLQSWGFDVYCPDFYSGKVFGYHEEKEAYAYFYEHVGLEWYRFAWKLLDELKQNYEKVYVFGYSVGATLAWRCSENIHCAGVVACYGSRIRNYLQVVPQCPVLVVLAEKDCFNVDLVVETLQKIPCTQVKCFPAEHGFMDACSKHYDSIQATKADEIIWSFLK